ncbi:multifunctional CCA tRNA nucleotidyl transferase/2'3'-cyclic phosphodiesterase/2'nucleotidase/phosphatase [Pseudomonas putida]|uniref:multifunctional CCA tRNA nucleotidyl transferase/2'3'-cyclic phosphodiesterase/2'nucleotidase/phosphatase n=1 Tax=Pseudomonas putida TaxID=303 RepID=UPI000DB4E761|nr:multifunctional CCA tRNA nucleotidyl transferase/2'3'-cyclic phosphodiesterase/2'nucleotidase/phosphatase [Pseudomonas putida]MBI6942155.1 multifunctional CCA tRNA nucleotidyl transferase/2'3'-cyclic phosphodiesterase/2'nucleotidase/phosphatase [Pseudomonas putida]MBI6959142.1 multifunctional CCA tRNA nucleotidyl transferase/2'3'-cyclic phosphodiesterase/2'nucleotidase/phosphatase [Pseudomonas putida]PZQ37339.1 MAG: multifunctional CCA tRNA nucleotidyl transferase/2'3'-cyclic phosphodiesteras
MHIYKVGGAVRDRLLGRPVSDTDWLVVGATVEEMLAKGFRPVGADFPVFLHPKTGEEYALARTERKSGRGYGGFTFHASPDVTLEEDLTRRDLTINAMAEDDQGNILDPYGGRTDLEQRVLRHVSPAFAEDPLRVLRVARFAARYAPLGFQVADATLELMRQISASGELLALTAERSWKEIERALMEDEPQVFIEVLRDCGALKALMPELETPAASLTALTQAAKHHLALPVRWACLLHGLDLASLKALNQRFKAPRECQELAMLVGEFAEQGHSAFELEPEALLALLQRFDVYRRPQRFEDFITACEMQALGERRPDYPQAQYLRAAAAAARAVDVKPLVQAGLKGQALGEALKAERLKALEAYKASA